MHLEQDAADESSPVSAEGRFEFAAVPRGLTRIRLVSDQVLAASAGFTTEQFPL